MKAFISPEDMQKMKKEGKVHYRPKKRRKYASYQNHLNRKRVIII